MLPHEAQALMAKFVFLIFAALIILMGQVKAQSLENFLDQTPFIHSQAIQSHIK